MTALRIEKNGALASIVFSVEKGLNILSVGVLKELAAAWSDVEKHGARVCILRGEGKAFLAGANIKEMAAFSGPQAREFAALGQSVFGKIENSEVVSIAAIHGACMGGGCELALACDIRIGSTGMAIGQPEVNIGLIPGFGGSQRLPRVVGQGWALRMILSGEPLNETQAQYIGLVTEIGPAEDLPDRAEKLARTILSRGPVAVKTAKRLTRAALSVPLNDGLAAEAQAFGKTFECGEAKEGTAAFIEKRAAKF